MLELRVGDAELFTFAAVNASTIDNNAVIFADRRIGERIAWEAGVNNTIYFANLHMGVNRTLIVGGRNGYGISFNSVSGGSMCSLSSSAD